MNGKNLCYNCFKEKPQPEGPCPYCGFDLAENQEKFPIALKAGTVLNSRYILGRVLGQGGFGITYVAWDEKLAARVAVKEYMPGELAARMDGKTLSVMTAAGGMISPTARSVSGRKPGFWLSSWASQISPG